MQELRLSVRGRVAVGYKAVDRLARLTASQLHDPVPKIQELAATVASAYDYATARTTRVPAACEYHAEYQTGSK